MVRDQNNQVVSDKRRLAASAFWKLPWMKLALREELLGEGRKEGRWSIVVARIMAVTQ